jgi:hypothetical protein
LSFVGIFAWNESETYRLVRSIKNGSQFVHSPSKDRIFLELCPVSLEEIKRRASFANIIGIVGPKSTGKSYSLTALGYELENVVKFTLSSNNYGITSELGDQLVRGLADAIVFEMRQQICNLPWPFTRFRLSSINSKKIIANVFQKVHRDTGIPVTLLLDIDMKSQNADFNCEKLTRALKAMVCDAEMMQCVFAASEGLLFQAEANREPRLELLYSRELSIEASIAYLKRFSENENVDVCDLSGFPRVFSNLNRYRASGDKKTFVEGFARSNKIKLQRLSVQQRDLLRKALSHPIDVNDYMNCKLTEDDVMQMVKLNILILTPSGEFEIQFDSWRETIENFPN